MNAFVDQDACISCGLCVGIQPAVFQMNDENKSFCCCEITDDLKDTVQEAIDSCPTNAIHWE